MSKLGNLFNNIFGQNGNLFQQSGGYGEGYFNHDNGYSDTQSLSASANTGLGKLLDPTGTVAGLWNDITGVSAQSREFSQQEYLQDKQNEYNKPENQMLRMIEAGINPNLAAAGISGGGNESAQAPAVSSNTSGAAQGLASAAGAVASLGAGAASFAGATEIGTLLTDKKALLQAQTIHELESAGLDHWNAVSVSTLLPTLSANQQADFYLKLANYDNLRAEYQVILDEHELKLEEIRLTGSLADEASEKARFAKETTDFFVAHGFRDDAPLDVSLRNSVVNGKKDQASKIGASVESYNYSASRGAFRADAETAYQRMYNSFQGQAAGNKDYARYLNELEKDKVAYTNFIESLYALPDDAYSFLVYELQRSQNAIFHELGDYLSKDVRYKNEYIKEKERIDNNLGGKNHPRKGDFRWD